VGASPFWKKGVFWAMQVAHMGIKWVIGNGRKIKVWKDHWIGNTSLAIAYWPLYVIQTKIVWDGENLMLTLRRSMSSSTMNLWWELLSLMALSEEEDQILWNFTSSGKYTVQSLYVMINHRGGVTP
jgi:hypothetical protein